MTGGKFTMPASDVIVWATLKELVYTVTVENGTAIATGNTAEQKWVTSFCSPIAGWGAGWCAISRG